MSILATRPRSLALGQSVFRSQRQGGFHLYYGDDLARGNGRFDTGGCSGEIRGARGYLILHQGADQKIARSLDSGVQLNLFPFPVDLLQSHEAELIVPAPVNHAHAKVSLKLEVVYEGARNDSLFEVGRQWAYRQRRGDDLGAWIAERARLLLLQQQPLPRSHAPRRSPGVGLQRGNVGLVRVQRDRTGKGPWASRPFEHRAIVAWHLVGRV